MERYSKLSARCKGPIDRVELMMIASLLAVLAVLAVLAAVTLPTFGCYF